MRAGQAFPQVHALASQALRLLPSDLCGFSPTLTLPPASPPLLQPPAGPPPDVAALAEAQRAKQRAEQRAEQEGEQRAPQQEAQQLAAREAATSSREAAPAGTQAELVVSSSVVAARESTDGEREEAVTAAAAATRATAAVSPEEEVHEKRRREAEEDDMQLLMVRLLALQEYFERCRRIARAGKAQQFAVPWSLRLSRRNLVPDVLAHFGQLTTGVTGGTGPLQLWRNTNVRFVDAFDVDEPGIDQGGLTAELHATFWCEVFKPEHALFEQGDGGRYLPCAGAPADALEAVGRMLLKSIIDDHPTGRLLSRFVLEFLADSHERRVFLPSRPLEALRALEDFDPGLAKMWRRCVLEMSDEELSYLTLEVFEPSLGEGVVTRGNVAAAVVAGCRCKLLLERQAELQALRRGFTFRSNMDLALQLARSWSIVHTARPPLRASPQHYICTSLHGSPERHLRPHTSNPLSHTGTDTMRPAATDGACHHTHPPPRFFAHSCTRLGPHTAPPPYYYYIIDL